MGDWHVAIPKPFELGALMSTLPDRAVRLAEGYDGTQTFKDSMARVIENVFRIGAMPALFAPAAEVATNTSSLTKHPIIPEYLQKVEPPEQYNPYTSPTVKAIAQHMPEFMPDSLRSPLDLQT